ncbi:MAG TPA: protein-glutamate O-methyltransferase [Rhizomicrobium sp.]|nr:protein-glutamate O-methyltransferase [Rhizomicrobium sp.]
MTEPRNTSSKTSILHGDDNEFLFSVADFLDIAQILRADTGISLEQNKMSMVYARLAKRLRVLGLGDFRKYRKLLASEEGGEERKRMARALTTNTTSFFREMHHFDHLRHQVLPKLISDARKGARIRIWSAGCSSGEEPYSIALTLLSMAPDADDLDIKILATDIDTDILGKGKDGVYSSTALMPVDEALRERWILPHGIVDGEKHWRMHPNLKKILAFKQANLIGAWPMKGPFQVIFCRNTVIYFEDDVRREIWAKMAGLLPPGGHLYIGHSERIPFENQVFAPAGITVYRRNHTESSDSESGMPETKGIG